MYFYKSRISTLCVGLCVLFFVQEVRAQGSYENRRRRRTAAAPKTQPQPRTTTPVAPPPALPQGANTAANQLTGKVIDDATGEPIVGANVAFTAPQTGSVLGGVFTDENGEFSFAHPGELTSLGIQINAVGYKTVKSVAKAGPRLVVCPLSEDVLKLDEIVVTAYGRKERHENLNVALQTIETGRLTTSGEVNLGSGFIGKIAGMQALQSSGVPGASTSLILRGFSTINGYVQPLFVVDGTPMDNSTFTNGLNPFTTNADYTNNFTYSNRVIDLNPDDIQSISVLKGPAAAALYGTRAGHGVISVTTKKGSGEPGLKVEWVNRVGIESPNRLFEMQNVYAQGNRGVYLPPTRPDGFGGAFMSYGPRIDSIPGLKAYDNQDAIFKTGVLLQSTLSVSNTREKSSYHLSIGATNHDGFVEGINFNRYTLKGGYEAKLSTRFRLTGGINISRSGGSRREVGSGRSLMQGIYRGPASYDFAAGYVNPDGTQRVWATNFGFDPVSGQNIPSGSDNPFWGLKYNRVTDDVNRLLGNVALEYAPLDWLSITYRVGGDFYVDERSQFRAKGARNYPLGSISRTVHQVLQVYSDLYATARKQLSRKVYGALTLGNNLASRYHSQNYLQGTELIAPYFESFSNAKNQSGDYRELTLRNAGYFADAFVDYGGWLKLNATLRAEQVSTLPANNNLFFFPGVSAGAVISELPFYNKQSFVSYLKVQTSFTQVGIEPPPFATQNYYEATAVSPEISSQALNQQTLNLPINGQPGFTQSLIKGNPNLIPERLNALEGGVDIGFYKNRFGLSIVGYYQKTNDVVLKLPLAPSSGYSAIFSNQAELENKGFEITLTGRPISKKDFSWSFELNFSLNRNIVTKMPAAVKKYDMATVDIATPASASIIQDQPFGVLTGSKFKRDAQGRMLIGADGYPIADTRTDYIVGNPNPKFILGFTNILTFHKFKLITQFDFRAGGDIVNLTLAEMYYYGTAKETEKLRTTTKVFEGVLANGEPNTKAVPLNQSWFYDGNGGRKGPTEQWVQDATNFRIREITLQYPFNLRGKKIKNIALPNIELSLTGRNVFLYAPNMTGFDPENNMLGSGSNARGIELYNMPATRSFLLGARFIF